MYLERTSGSITWLSAPVHTGKTTLLQARVAARPGAYCGVLAPVDEHGSRSVLDLVSGEQRQLSCPADKPSAIAVGPYHFCPEAFTWARQVLARHHARFPDRCLIVDELGKLELSGRGLAPACWNVLALRQRFDGSALVVVRDSLLSEVLERLFEK